jgi:endonuclease G
LHYCLQLPGGQEYLHHHDVIEGSALRVQCPTDDALQRAANHEMILKTLGNPDAKLVAWLGKEGTKERRCTLYWKQLPLSDASTSTKSIDEFCMQFTDFVSAKSALDAANRDQPSEFTSNYHRVPYVKTPYTFKRCTDFECECKAEHDKREQEIRAKFETKTTNLQERRSDNARQHGEEKDKWDAREASRVEAHKEYMAEAGKLKKLIKQMEHAKGDTTTLEDVINSLTLVVKAMGKIKTAFASVRMYWDYVRQRSKWMSDKCGEIAANAKALGDDGEDGDTLWFDIEDATEHIEESANVWMSLCLQSWRSAEQIQCAESMIDSFMEDLSSGGKDDIRKQCSELLKVLDEEENAPAPLIKEIKDLTPGDRVDERCFHPSCFDHKKKVFHNHGHDCVDEVKLHQPGDKGRLVDDTLFNAICRVEIHVEKGMEKGIAHGSGFWTVPPGQAVDCIMTNNHVLQDKSKAQQAELCFGYRSEGQGVAAKLDPEKLFYTNKELDFTIVAIDDESLAVLRQQDWSGPLKLAPKQFSKEDNIIIKGHPDGQRLAEAEGKITDVSDTRCGYAADTDQGMSGCPVMDSSKKVVLLHAQGGRSANWGYNMGSIIDDIQAHFKDVKDMTGDDENRIKLIGIKRQGYQGEAKKDDTKDKTTD